jgi:hypothetical protein
MLAPATCNMIRGQKMATFWITSFFCPRLLSKLLWMLCFIYSLCKCRLHSWQFPSLTNFYISSKKSLHFYSRCKTKQFAERQVASEFVTTLRKFPKLLNWKLQAASLLEIRMTRLGIFSPFEWFLTQANFSTIKLIIWRPFCIKIDNTNMVWATFWAILEAIGCLSLKHLVTLLH